MSDAIPGDLLVAILFGEVEEVASRVERVADRPGVVAACLRVAQANGRRELAERIRSMGLQPARDESPSGALRRGGAGPTISILLANHNDAVFLLTSLEAMLSQTVAADEIIIVDDASTDDSVAVIRDFLAREPRARMIRNERNSGPIVAINAALQAARSDYIVWAAADDVLLPGFIEGAKRALAAHPGTGVCFSPLCTWRDGTRVVRPYRDGVAFALGDGARYYSAAQLRERLRRHYLWISSNTVAARRDALLAMGGFDAGLRWHADWFAYYAIALRYGACALTETLAILRERPATYSSGGMRDKVAHDAVLQRIVSALGQPENRDLLQAVRECPSLFSPFGARLLVANLRKPSSWGVIGPFFRWLVLLGCKRLLSRLTRRPMRTSAAFLLKHSKRKNRKAILRAIERLRAKVGARLRHRHLIQ
jgi:glycosyltransferase involved in cell wall biosynthesis